MRATEGYSLYELLVTLAIATTLVVIGVPAFTGTLARSRQHVEIDALFHAAHAARMESIMRHRVVSLCPSADGLRCAPGYDWSQGWLLFANNDADDPPERDSDEPLLDVHHVQATTKIRANRKGFTFRATQKRATNGTFVVCDRAGRVAPKAMVVSFTGRPRVATTQTDGKPYACTD